MTTPPSPAPRYAWYGRVSTDDEQDPTLSFPRQLQNAERQVAEAGGRIVAHYYDIESGTRAYTARGSGGLAGFDIPIPRDGGLQDLLADTAQLRALFDALQLDVVFRPADSAVVVAVTLYDGGENAADLRAQVRAEDWSAPPGGVGPVLRRVVQLNRRLTLLK